MDLRQILEFLSQERVSRDESTVAELEGSVAGFASNPAGATGAIRRLRVNDPAGFVVAAIRLLISAEERTAGVQFVAGLMFTGEAALDGPITEEEAAAALARNLDAVEPMLDVRLIDKMLSSAGEIRKVEVQTAMRVLTLVEAISDCSRLSSYLVQMMRHPSAQVRSKVTLLLGRANLNLHRIEEFLTSEDPRLRANAVESLWGRRGRQVLAMLRVASADDHGRVAINALVGLCRAGERDAYVELQKMACSQEAALRAGVAWAMGELGDPASKGLLGELERDANEKVRAMAARSLKRLACSCVTARKTECGGGVTSLK